MIEWLLGIDHLDPSDPAVSFGWTHAIPGWGWLLILAAAGLIAWLSYSRLDTPRPAKLLLGAARLLLLVLLVVLLAGPRLTKPNDRTERDWFVLMADRSASMTIADAPGGETRESQLKAALDTVKDPIDHLRQTRRVLTLGFDSGVFNLPTDDTTGDFSLAEPDGRRTLLGRSLDRALDEVAARPVAGIVIVSDGASSDSPSRKAMQRLRRERIPVFVVPIGSPDPVSDLAVTRVEAPEAGYVNDRVPVMLSVDRLGSAERGSAWAELVERSTGLVLDRRKLDPNQTEITLIAKPRTAGQQHWTARLVPDGQDLIAENNSIDIAINLVDRPLRVLQLDGYPRWEFRYTKNLLLREPTISSSSLLLSSRRRYIQDGDIEMDRLPDSPEQWEGIDVIVMGDVRADLFTQQQLEQIYDLVAVRGAGLLWVAGPGATPDTWRGTPLEPLLPMSLSAPSRAFAEPVTMIREPAADRLGLLELADDAQGGWPERLSDPDTGWSQLRWAQNIDPNQIKPTAEILASARTGSAADPTPLVLTMRFGAGRIIYVGTDEIWRWRYARGEELPERFWIPLIRLLGREGLARAGRGAIFRASPRRTETGSPVRLSLELIDEQLAQQQPGHIAARIEQTDRPAEIAPVILRPEPTEPGRSPTLAGVWLPPGPGQYRLTIDDPLLQDQTLEQLVEVFAHDDELRRPETDFAALASLAETTGGNVLSPDQLADIEDILPNRQRRIAGTPDIEPLWDSPIALIALTLILAVEWIGRRLVRLM